MPLFDSLSQKPDPLTAIDPLLMPATAPGISAADATGSDAAADGWASLRSWFAEQPFDEALFGSDGFGGGAAAPEAVGIDQAVPSYAAATGWPGDPGGFGGGVTGYDFGPPAARGGRLDALRDDDAGSAPGEGGPAGAGGPVDAGPEVMAVDIVDFAKGGNGKGGGNPGGGGDPGALDSYSSAGAYNIDIKFKGEWTGALQQAFIDSADLLSATILSDVPDVFYRGKIIDDIRIDAELAAIDGEGGILGRAGPTAVRTDGYLPATAIMEFDVADAQTYDAAGLWGDIVLHEMMHSIGFGTIWEFQGLLSGGGGDAPLFTGDNATLTYDFANGTSGSAGVPVEQDGGPGTRDSHWDEETFGNEIMTGYIDAANYLSDMTVASLEDLGYDTVWTPDDYMFA